MRIIRSDSFKRDYQKLSEDLQRRADKQLGFFLQDLHHPSLRTKKMEGMWGQLGIFEARVTKGYRFTFMIQDDQYILRRIGPHDILKNP